MLVWVWRVLLLWFVKLNISVLQTANDSAALEQLKADLKTKNGEVVSLKKELKQAKVISQFMSYKI